MTMPRDDETGQTENKPVDEPSQTENETPDLQQVEAIVTPSENHPIPNEDVGPVSGPDVASIRHADVTGSAADRILRDDWEQSPEDAR